MCHAPCHTMDPIYHHARSRGVCVVGKVQNMWKIQEIFCKKSRAPNYFYFSNQNMLL